MTTDVQQAFKKNKMCSLEVGESQSQQVPLPECDLECDLWLQFIYCSRINQDINKGDTESPDFLASEVCLNLIFFSKVWKGFLFWYHWQMDYIRVPGQDGINAGCGAWIFLHLWSWKIFSIVNWLSTTDQTQAFAGLQWLKYISFKLWILNNFL